jgi:DNA-binding GntR family transcriptional regulator
LEVRPARGTFRRLYTFSNVPRANDVTPGSGARPSATRTTKVGALHQPLTAVVLKAIRQAIVTGVYAPGQRLVEEDLAAELDVSRAPVRESLHLLAVEGFVEIEPRRGARVATFSRKQADDLFVVRLTLEGLVAQLAAERRTDLQLAELRRVATEGLAAAKAGRTDELPALNTLFHQTLADTADNAILADHLSTLSSMIQWVYAKRIRERLTDSWSEHMEIVEAIADRDPDRALKSARRHVENAWVAYVGPDES